MVGHTEIWENRLARCALGMGLSLFVLISGAEALEVQLDAGAGTLAIADNDGNDLEPEAGIIRFDTTASPVAGVLAARGSVQEEVSSSAGRGVFLPPLDLETEVIFQNVGTGSLPLTVMITSSTFPSLGERVGWGFGYDARADDPTPDDVEIAEVGVSLHAGPTLLGAYTADDDPNQPALPPELQPIALASPSQLATNESADPTSLRLTFTATLGPNDRLRFDEPGSLWGNVFLQRTKCIVLMAKHARSVGKQAAKGDDKCIKLAGGGDATSCIDDPSDLPGDRDEAKLFKTFERICSPLPAWGVNGGSCCENGASDGAPCVGGSDCPEGACIPGACVSGAAEAAVRSLAHDLFGDTIVVPPGARSCQGGVRSAASKLLDARWIELARTLKAEALAIDDDASFASIALGPAQSSSKISTFTKRLLSAVTGKCIDKGVAPVAALFPGACAGASDASFGACVAGRVACRFCRAVNVATDVDPPLDCDSFDDGSMNASCAP